MAIIKEWTCGSFGKFLWWRWCFWISIDDSTLTIRIPFKRYDIPVQLIDEVVSDSSWGFFGKTLRVMHRSKNAPRSIQFVSIQWASWFDAFERCKVKTSDPKNLRNAPTTYLKIAKWINLGAGVLGVVVAIAAVFVVLIALGAKLFGFQFR